MRKTLIVVLALYGAPVFAADKALILNEQRQQALYQALDAAVRQQGIAAAPALIDLLNVLRTAPTVEETKPAEVKKDNQPQ